MNKLLSISTTAATILTVTVATSGSALAWHPKAELTKTVRNDTQKTSFVEADNNATAVAANTGDVLTYQIDIVNKASSNDGIDNSMRNTVLDDTLPTGVELVSDPSLRTIHENLGDVKPGQTVTKTYKVKVTSTKDGDVVTNKACFTGDQELGDRKQNGCDTAVVKVSVPKTPVTPAPVKETPAPVQAPAELPKTGISATALIGTSLTALVAYAAFIIRARRVNA